MYEKLKVNIALDLSTTVCGIAIFDSDTTQLIELTYHSFNELILVQKGIGLSILLDEFISKYEIQNIAIEERLKSFRAGGTNAASMLQLAQFNFLCQYFLFKKGITYKEINVQNARALAYPAFHVAARKVTGMMKQKEFAFELVKKELGEEIFPTKINKSGKNKGNKVFLEEAKDMSDAFILGKALIEILKGNEKPVKVKAKKKVIEK